MPCFNAMSFFMTRIIFGSTRPSRLSVVFHRFVWNSTLNRNTAIASTCNMDQLSNYTKEYAAKFHFGNISRFYYEPCYQASNVVSSTQSLIPLRDDSGLSFGQAYKTGVKIRIDYAMKGYKKATNHRSFGMLSLLSQIGGFVGMVLGYSLLQLPDLAFKNIQNTRNLMNKNSG